MALLDVLVHTPLPRRSGTICAIPLEALLAREGLLPLYVETLRRSLCYVSIVVARRSAYSTYFNVKNYSKVILATLGLGVQKVLESKRHFRVLDLESWMEQNSRIQVSTMLCDADLRVLEFMVKSYIFERHA